MSIVIVSLLSIITKVNIFNVFAIVILGGVVSILLLKKDKYLLYSLLISSLILKPLIFYFHLPNIIYYVVEILLLLIIIKLLFFKRKKVELPYWYNKYKLMLVIMLIVSIISMILNRENIINFFYGVRVHYKFLIIPLIFPYLNINDEEKKCCINIFKIFMFIQIPIVVIQNKLGYIGDNQGGWFGDGGTSILAINLTLTFILLLDEYMRKKTKLLSISIFTLLVFVISALAEIKLLFLTIPVILISVIILNRLTIKNIIITIIIIISLGTAYEQFIKIYPVYKDFLSQERLNEYLYSSGYSGDGTVNRFSSLQFINDNMHNNVGVKLFGVGIGNASPSNISIFQGEYYKKYEESKYYRFWISYVYSEVGILGIIVYLIIINYLLFICLKNKSKCRNIGISMFILFIITSVYNQGILVNEIGIPFWILLTIFNCGGRKSIEG